MSRLISIGLAFAVLSVFSQSPYSIKGVITDQNDSLLVINALLLHKIDSTLLKGSIVYNGILRFEDIIENEAILKLESPDITSLFIPISRPTGIELDLGNIKVESGRLLNSITVNALKPTFTSGSAGEVIINVKGSMLESSSSVQDVLSKSPGIIIEDGVISVFGKGEAIILVNDKLISNHQLAAIPVNAIESIYILTNPPAKYDASGKAVINIRLIQNPHDGFSGEIVQTTTLARHWQSYTSLTVNYQKNKLALQGSYTQDLGRNWGSNVLTRETYSDLGNTRAVNDFEDNSNLKYFSIYNLGITYSITSKSSLSFEYTGNSSITAQNANAQTVFFIPEQNKTTIHTQNYGNNSYLSNSFLLNYSITTDTLGSNLFIGGQYFLFAAKNEIFINEEINTGILLNRYNHKNLSSSNISFGTAQADFQKYIRNTTHKLEIGGKITYANNGGIVDFYSKAMDNNQYTSFPGLSNDFIYNEWIGALYTQYAIRIGEKTNLSLGIRGELTNATGFSNALATSVIDTTYISLFPSINITQQFNSKWNAGLSLSSTIRRPSYQALDPFLFYVDSLTTNQGSPLLRPEYAYSIEGHLQYKHYSLKIGYTITRDAFRYALLPGTNGQSSSTLMQINMQKENSYFATLQIPITAKVFRSNTIIGLTLDKLADDRPEFIPDRFIPRFYFFSNNTLKIGKLGKLQVGFRYLGVRYDGLYYRKPAYNLSLGWSRSFFKERLTCSFLADDLLHSFVVDGHYTFNSSKVSYLRKMNTRLYRVTLVFHFGKLKESGFSSLRVGDDSTRRIRK